LSEILPIIDSLSVFVSFFLRGKSDLSTLSLIFCQLSWRRITDKLAKYHSTSAQFVFIIRI